MELVSIIIPIFNAQNFIELCLDSVLRQTYEHLEVILVDDGSSDASREICDNYEKMDQRIRVYHRENAGVSASRNFGLNHAKGKYVLFVDADDTIETNMIEDCVQLAQANGADLVICSFRYYITASNQMIENCLGRDFTGSKSEFFRDWFDVLMDREIINPPWNKFVKKDLLERNHIRFNEKYSICEDMAYSIQVLAASKKTVLTGEMYYNYYVKSSGTLVFKFHENYFEALSYFYQSTYEYCLHFKENSKQLKCLNTLYLNRIIAFLKQISTKSGWNKKLRYEAMIRIASNDKFLGALKSANLNCKKKLVCFLLRFKQFGLIHLLYKFKSKRE